MQKNITNHIDVYNSKYNTSFKVKSTLSLDPSCIDEAVGHLKSDPNSGGVYILEDKNHELLAVYSTKNFYSSNSLKRHLQTEIDSSGKWVFKENWIANPAHLTFIVGDQSRLYEKDSLRSYLIQELNPRYNEAGQLVR